MAESDVAIAPPEISPVDNQTQESEPPSEAAAAAALPNNSAEEMEKEVMETQEKEEVEVESEEAAAGEEAGEANQDLKRKLEVQEETKRQPEGAGNGEDANEGGEEREGSEAKRQKTETDEAPKSGEALEEEPRGTDNLPVKGEALEEEPLGTENLPVKGEALEEEPRGTEDLPVKGEALEEEPQGTENLPVKGEALEEEPRGTENLEHDVNNNLEQTAEGDMQKDDFTTDKTETVDGSSDTCRKIEVPNHRVGVLIGKAGDTIRNMQKLSGARIQIVKDSDTAPDATTRTVEILGSFESIDKAEQLIRDVLAEADAGRPPPLYGRGFTTSQSSTSEVEIQVPNDKVGSIIGKGGQMIKDLQARSGAHILLIPIESSEEEDVKERTVRLSGNKQQVEAAKYMIRDIINQTGRSHSQNRGGAGQRQSYGSRGPGSQGYGSQKQWGPPRQNHQSHSPGYSKYPNQRGKNYSQQFPQNPRQNYGKYPPARTSGRGAAMGSSWDQRAPFAGNQQPPQYGASGGLQYGHQQQPHGYGAPNPYQQNAVPPQQSLQAPPPQQFYGQQATQPGYQQQTYSAMYPQGQVPGGTYGTGVAAQQQNPYAQYGQAYSQPAGADGYSQQYPQQYPQQSGQAATGYSQVAPAAYNYGYQGGVADPSTGYSAGASQAGYGQMMPATQAGYVQEQPVSQGGYDQTVQPAAAGPTAQASGAPVVGGQWQG